MKVNEQGEYLDINPHVHKLPDSNHLKPVVFARKSLHHTECRYVKNECKFLAVLTGLKRFHYYTYHRIFHVINHHNSLVNIIQKDLAEMPARLQRIACQTPIQCGALFQKGKVYALVTLSIKKS